MCRSIKQLRSADIPATEEEIHSAALQFVRKVSGYRSAHTSQRLPGDYSPGSAIHSSRAIFKIGL
jgi:hypothetical protein